VNRSWLIVSLMIAATVEIIVGSAMIILGRLLPIKFGWLPAILVIVAIAVGAVAYAMTNDDERKAD
jgi:hypothetical protein